MGWSSVKTHLRHVHKRVFTCHKYDPELPPMSLTTLLRHFFALKSVIVVVLAFLLPLDLVHTVDPAAYKRSRCAYVIIVMAILWLTEAAPIPVTSLLPIVLFPMLGVSEAKDISSAYFSDTSMLFVGGLILAVGVEECGLHKRIALGVMRIIGSHPSMIMLGLMLPTWFLSMWISNTAATSMMLPIIHAVVDTVTSLHHEHFDHLGIRNVAFQMDDLSTSMSTISSVRNLSTTSSQPGSSATSHSNIVNMDPETEDAATKPEVRRLAKGLTISVAYAANIGGIATLTGTPPNLVLKKQADGLYQNMSRNAITESPVSFATWMGFAFPLSLLTLALGWVWLQVIFLRGRCLKKTEPHERTAINDTLKRQFRTLGKMTFAECMVLIVFVIMVILWLFRDPPNINGWGKSYYNAEEKKPYISDSTPALLMSLLLFVLPSSLPSVFCWAEDRDKPTYTPILSWTTVELKIPWGILLLLGGGFAIAEASKVSGLSMWIGTQLRVLGSLEPWFMNLLISIIVAMATEVSSNTATANLLLPILASLALNLNVHPLYLMITTTVACSFAFMLPVATPPNALVFSTGYISITDMALAGLPMNLFALFCLTLAVNTWGVALYDLDNIPQYFIIPTTNATTAATFTTAAAAAAANRVNAMT